VPVEHPEVDTWSRSAPAESKPAEPEDSVEPPDVNEAEPSSEHLGLAVGERGDREWCDSDGGQGYEGKQRDSVCVGFVAPPGFDQALDRFDDDQDGDRDEEFRHRDRDWRNDRSSEARVADSDERGHDESDRQEERHDHESPDDDSSTGRD